MSRRPAGLTDDVLSAYQGAALKMHGSAGEDIDDAVNFPDVAHLIGSYPGGKAYRVEDGWGEFYIADPDEGAAFYVCCKMPDVMAVDVPGKFGGKIRYKELGMGDAKWDAAVIAALGGDAVESTEKVGWTDEARAAAARARAAGARSVQTGTGSKTPAGPHRVTLRMGEIEHTGDMDRVAEALHSIGAKLVTMRQMDERDEYESGEFVVDVEDLAAFRAAFRNHEDLHGLGGATEITPLEKKPMKKDWTEKRIADLPDSAFAYVEPGGVKDAEGKTSPRVLRQLAYRDEAGAVDVARLEAAIEAVGKAALPEVTKSRVRERLEKVLKAARPEERAPSLAELNPGGWPLFGGVWKAWSDEAREAALEARRRNGKKSPEKPMVDFKDHRAFDGLGDKRLRAMLDDPDRGLSDGERALVEAELKHRNPGKRLMTYEVAGKDGKPVQVTVPQSDRDPASEGAAAEGGGTPASQGSAAARRDDDARAKAEPNKKAGKELAAYGWKHEGGGKYSHSDPGMKGHSIQVSAKPNKGGRTITSWTHSEPGGAKPLEGTGTEQLAYHVMQANRRAKVGDHRSGLMKEAVDEKMEELVARYEEFVQQVSAAAKSASGPGSRVQSLVFDKDQFKSLDEAKAWAADHNFSHEGEIEDTGKHFRVRQEEPAVFDHLRTITLTPGVEAVVGYEKAATEAVATAFVSHTGRLAYKSEQVEAAEAEPVAETAEGVVVWRIKCAGQEHFFAEAGGVVVAQPHYAALSRASEIVAKQAFVPIVKGEEQRFTLSVVYPCSKRGDTQPDFHGDIMTADELEKSAWGFMGKGVDRIGLMHRPGTDGAGRVVESYIWRAPEWKVDKDMGGLAQAVRPGDWVMGIVWNAEVWPAVKSGQLAGVSLQGAARKEAFEEN